MNSSQPQIAVDPNLAAEQQQAEQDRIASLQTQANSDTAALMAQYGTRLALSGTGVTAPTVPSAPPSAVR
jgi:hypothetical protein